jgi:hypothetical protein
MIKGQEDTGEQIEQVEDASAGAAKNNLDDHVGGKIPLAAASSVVSNAAVDVAAASASAMSVPPNHQCAFDKVKDSDGLRQCRSPSIAGSTMCGVHTRMEKQTVALDSDAATAKVSAKVPTKVSFQEKPSPLSFDHVFGGGVFVGGVQTRGNKSAVGKTAWSVFVHTLRVLCLALYLSQYWTASLRTAFRRARPINRSKLWHTPCFGPRCRWIRFLSTPRMRVDILSMVHQ